MTRLCTRHSPGVLAFGLALALSGCSGGSDGSEREGTATARLTYLDKTSIPEDPAEMVFEQTCMSCHATGVGPVITGRNLPPEAVKLFVRNGIGAMPAFTEAMIDDETLDGVARLVAESPAPPGAPAQ